MKNHVVSLDLAKQLKEAGYPQGEGFYWTESEDHKHECNCPQKWRIYILDKPYKNTVCVVAPLATELLNEIKIHGNEIAIGYNDSSCYWHFQFGGRGSGNMIEGIGRTFSALEADTLQDALAELWLYLKNENLL